VSHRPSLTLKPAFTHMYSHITISLLGRQNCSMAQTGQAHEELLKVTWIVCGRAGTKILVS
jgi:hypothetical protein